MQAKSELKSQYISLVKSKLAEKAKSGMLNFTLYTHHDYEINWHHKALCQFLNRFVKKEIKRAMVFMPPRTGKSELVSRRLPAFIHGNYPNDDIMTATYNNSLATDMTTDVQKVMDLPEYREIFPRSKIVPPGTRHPTAVRNSEEHHIIGHRGKYRGQGIGGTFTGRGAQWILIDDPIKGREAADSKSFREKLWKWYGSDLRSRLEKDGSILITLTRWHEDDLAGRLIREMKADPNSDQWTIIEYPAIKDIKNDYDPRQVGDALWPSKYPLSELEKIKALGSRNWNALYQQRPSSAEGTIIKREWIKFYKELPELTNLTLSADLTFKNATHSDFVVIQVWGSKGSERYLIHQVRERMSFTAAIKAFRTIAYAYPNARRKLVEEAANGAALIDTLKGELEGIVPVRPRESKDVRLYDASILFEAGNVFFPDPSIAPWINDTIEELVSFPSAPHDDTVDACSQYLNDSKQNQAAMNRLSRLTTM